MLWNVYNETERKVVSTIYHRTYLISKPNIQVKLQMTASHKGVFLLVHPIQDKVVTVVT